MNRIQAFLKRKNVLFSAKRYGVDAMGAMAQGLFASLLIGTIIKTLGQQLGAQFLIDAGNFAQQVAGPAMAVSIGAALSAPQLVLYSLIAVGMAANSLGRRGRPAGGLYHYDYCGRVRKTCQPRNQGGYPGYARGDYPDGLRSGRAVRARHCAAASAVGDFIKWATNLQPFLMGVLVSVAVGMALTLPISSAAICAALSLTGLAGGAAVAGCCAQMVGFAVISYRENGAERADQPGPGHLHAANAQHPAQSAHLDCAHAGLRRDGAAGYLPVPSGNERPCRIQRHGHLRTGRADRRIYRVAK